MLNNSTILYFYEHPLQIPEHYKNMIYADKFCHKSSNFWHSRYLISQVMPHASLEFYLKPHLFSSSLSHTKNASIFLPFSSGIDIEALDRKTHPKLQDKIDLQKIVNKSALEIWNIKEACYKALQKQPSTLKSIHLNKDHFLCEGEQGLFKQIIFQNKYLLSIACLEDFSYILDDLIIQTIT